MMLIAVTAACGGSHDHDADGDHSHSHEHDDGHEGHGDAAERVPNEGRVVRIISPANGDTFAEGEEIEIEIETENFDISEEGNHWHYYVGDGGATMITDGMDDRIRDLEPGEHMLKVFIAGSDHLEFEEGDAVMITVE